MEPRSPVTQRRAIIGIIAAGLLVMSFALVAALINRQASFAAGPICPVPGGTVSSPLVGVHTTTSSLTVTYFFDSIGDQGSAGTGVPGLIEYCVFADVTNLTNVTPQATGDNAQAFGANTGSNGFSFSRGDGDPSNIGLDGTTTQMGTATWSGSIPSQTFILHINDAAECERLYQTTEGSCWVFPSSGGQTPTPTNTPVGVPTPTNTPGPNDPTATPTIIPTPTGTPHPK